jgi:hypothetical protein
VETVGEGPGEVRVLLIGTKDQENNWVNHYDLIRSPGTPAIESWPVRADAAATTFAEFWLHIKLFIYRLLVRSETGPLQNALLL